VLVEVIDHAHRAWPNECPQRGQFTWGKPLRGLSRVLEVERLLSTLQFLLLTNLLLDCLVVQPNGTDTAPPRSRSSALSYVPLSVVHGGSTVPPHVGQGLPVMHGSHFALGLSSREGTFMARRIGRTSSGLTARGRGLMRQLSRQAVDDALRERDREAVQNSRHRTRPRPKATAWDS